MQFKTVQDVLDFAEADSNAWTYAIDLAHDYDSDPKSVPVILECFENEALCQYEMIESWPEDDPKEIAGRLWWAGRLRAYGYMLRAFGVKPAAINWKGE